MTEPKEMYSAAEVSELLSTAISYAAAQATDEAFTAELETWKQGFSEGYATAITCIKQEIFLAEALPLMKPLNTNGLAMPSPSLAASCKATLSQLGNRPCLTQL